MFAKSVAFTTTMPTPVRRMATMLLAATLLAALAGLRPPAAADASPLSVSPVSNAELEKMLSGIPLTDIPAGRLSEVLAKRLTDTPTGQLTETLEKTVEGLAAKGGTLAQLAGSPELSSELETQLKALPLLERLDLEGLLGILGEHTLSSVLAEALASLDGRQVVGELLKSASEPEQPIGPEEVIEQVLAAPGATTLEQLLGSTLAGQPFSKGTVEELASREGTTAEGLAQDFNATTAQLPGEALTLTAPLVGGKTVGVLDAVEGIDVGTLTHEPASGSGGTGGSGGGVGGPGGSGGSGDTGSSTPGGMTVIEELATPAAITPGTRTTSAKVRVLSHRVKGDTITLVVQAPAAGTLTVAGKGVRSLSRQASRAERLTVRTALTKAQAASLRKRRRRLEMTLDVSFKPVSGQRSSATTRVGID